jgi:hypothetical protein
MRRIFILVVLIGSLKANAQTYFPGSLGVGMQRQAMLNPTLLNDSTPGKKWFVSRYTGISTSFIFANGGNATVLSVPLGIQLNRKLNNNLYAFGGLAVAPSYINFNRSFLSTNLNKTGHNNGFMRSNQLNLSSRAEMGLMYVNDAKTFSISGSIGVERSTYPAFLPQTIGAAKPATILPSNR